jgi:hypothetical protein
VTTFAQAMLASHHTPTPHPSGRLWATKIHNAADWDLYWIQLRRFTVPRCLPFQVERRDSFDKRRVRPKRGVISIGAM